MFSGLPAITRLLLPFTSENPVLALSLAFPFLRCWEQSWCKSKTTVAPKRRGSFKIRWVGNSLGERPFPPTHKRLSCNLRVVWEPWGTGNVRFQDEILCCVSLPSNRPLTWDSPREEVPVRTHRGNLEAVSVWGGQESGFGDFSSRWIVCSFEHTLVGNVAKVEYKPSDIFLSGCHELGAVRFVWRTPSGVFYLNVFK